MWFHTETSKKFGAYSCSLTLLTSRDPPPKVSLMTRECSTQLPVAVTTTTNINTASKARIRFKRVHPITNYDHFSLLRFHGRWENFNLSWHSQKRRPRWVSSVTKFDKHRTTNHKLSDRNAKKQQRNMNDQNNQSMVTTVH